MPVLLKHSSHAPQSAAATIRTHPPQPDDALFHSITHTDLDSVTPTILIGAQENLIVGDTSLTGCCRELRKDGSCAGEGQEAENPSVALWSIRLGCG